MLKKIIAAVLLTGFIGILVWGGVNRTLAKTNDSEGRNANNQSAEHIEYTEASTEHAEYAEGNGVQQRGNGNQGNYAQDEAHDTESFEHSNEQDTAFSQGQDNGNGVQADTDEENAAALADGTGNGYGSNGENQAESQGNGNRGERGNGTGNGQGQGGGSDPLTATEIEALTMALDDEYHALAVYQSVIATFGEVEPFTEIAVSEQRHIDALVNQFDKHGLSIPENPWIGNVPIFDSVQQACQTGVEAEIANAALYDQLFSMTDDPRLTQVFTNLSNASLNSHLPEFQACQ